MKYGKKYLVFTRAQQLEFNIRILEAHLSLPGVLQIMELESIALLSYDDDCELVDCV